METLEPQGFRDFRFAASDSDFGSFPGNFVRKLSETDVQLRVKDVERMAIDSGKVPTCSLVRGGRTRRAQWE